MQLLRERGTFTADRSDCGAPKRCCTPELEEAVLHHVELMDEYAISCTCNGCCSQHRLGDAIKTILHIDGDTRKAARAIENKPMGMACKLEEDFINSFKVVATGAPYALKLQCDWPGTRAGMEPATEYRTGPITKPVMKSGNKLGGERCSATTTGAGWLAGRPPASRSRDAARAQAASARLRLAERAQLQLHRPLLTAMLHNTRFRKSSFKVRYNAGTRTSVAPVMAFPALYEISFHADFVPGQSHRSFRVLGVPRGYYLKRVDETEKDASILIIHPRSLLVPGRGEGLTPANRLRGGGVEDLLSLAPGARKMCSRPEHGLPSTIPLSSHLPSIYLFAKNEEAKKQKKEENGEEDDDVEDEEDVEGEEEDEEEELPEGEEELDEGEGRVSLLDIVCSWFHNSATLGYATRRAEAETLMWSGCSCCPPPPLLGELGLIPGGVALGVSHMRIVLDAVASL
ncbi:hypothetical protein PR048_001301 [Dryococelus australis]|uniref:Uncharacterized protein n=1 Tax=Dryococelus australis TaxID=614101 RepID=A0ABQ9IIG2_9NEOP|nr:hypothetical protein PR048_001301 [Dryococelus australis]